MHNAESVSLLHREDATQNRECVYSIYREEGGALSLYKGEGVSLLHREEADSFSKEERVPLLYVWRRDTPSLYKGESVSRLYI